MDNAIFQKALDFANLAHTGQKRLSGQPYITHPLAVAQTLQNWQLDDTAVVAGLLHDTVEDGGATHEDLIKEFGPEVATIVDGVTNITKIHLKGSTDEEFVENLRKMLLVMAQDLRVVLVKLADRLHNMQTLQYLPKISQLENARETLEIYAPLAERLGMGEVKGQLEDLAFPYVYPKEYAELIKTSKKLYSESEKFVEILKKELLKLLKPKIPEVIVSTRRKHLYSLFRKLNRPGIDGDWSKLYDLVAARVLVEGVDDCYIALGAIHGKWHVVPHLGMADFIANPKPNGYRSIHTRIFGPEGRITEIQIRTFQMHEEAEMGVAAHWSYSLAKSQGVSDEKLEKGVVSAKQSQLEWVKQLVSWQKEITDSEEYLRTLKFDALQHRNLVFSPKGDVFDLPRGATPIDYAYAVHGKLGHQAKGAKVNGKMVPLSHHLVNGDVVEILVDRNRKKPSHEWLGFVVTVRARQEINKELKS